MAKTKRDLAEQRRDLAADMSICEAATAGDDWTNFCPVACEYTTIVSEYDRLTEEPCALIAECERVEDATFISEARTGWPAAIRRAIDAEDEAANKLRSLIVKETELDFVRALLIRVSGHVIGTEIGAEIQAYLDGAAARETKREVSVNV